MEIKTVEMQEEGAFLVNKGIGQYFVPDNMDNRHCVMVQEWIVAGNTPTPFVGPTDMELWEQKMASSDNNLMIRDLEDLVTINNFTMTSEMKTRYDAKIKLRAVSYTHLTLPTKA